MTNLEAALQYAQRGWLVFPLHGIVNGQCTCRVENCPDSGKHPVTRRGWKDASKDPEVIKLWFLNNENVAIATGESSGITILDIDVGAHEGDQTWAELTKESGEPQTLMSRTGSGGFHVFFQYNSVLKTSSNTLGKGVDCRNDGGYIVAPPSLHRSGQNYCWFNEFPILPLPANLAEKPKKVRESGKKKKKSYSLKEVSDMLQHVPADDRDLWRSVGIILGREFDRSDDAWSLYSEWSAKWDGQTGRNHDTIMREAFHELSAQEGDLSLGTIVKAALDGGWAPKAGGVPIENFLYYAPGNNFIYRPTKEFWPGPSVDASTSPVNQDGDLVHASVWIKVNRLVTSMTNDPIIAEEVRKEFDCLEGILVPSKGGSLFNAYRPPIIALGDPEKASPWIEHVQKIFSRGGDADQFINYMAHRVQFPGVKPRFSLVLVGDQGLGKDTAISMCGPAMGEWNVENIDPLAIESSFNEYCAKVLVVISEVANAQDMSKWSFNEKLKVLIAGTPDNMVVNPKYGSKYSVRMHCGVIITTNHMYGLYIPQDDRRYDVIQCPPAYDVFATSVEKHSYFGQLWSWFNDGGASHIAAFLHARDLTKWNASTGQRITEAHREIVSSGYDGDGWLLEALERLGDPAVVTFHQIWQACETDTESGMNKKDVKARLGHVMPRTGFVRLVNKASADGRWKIGATMSVVFYHPQRTTMDEAIGFIRQGMAKETVF